MPAAGSATGRTIWLVVTTAVAGLYGKHARLDGRWLDVVIVEKLISENRP
jgi:hypothetical protein